MDYLFQLMDENEELIYDNIDIDSVLYSDEQILIDNLYIIKIGTSDYQYIKKNFTKKKVSIKKANTDMPIKYISIFASTIILQPILEPD